MDAGHSSGDARMSNLATTDRFLPGLSWPGPFEHVFLDVDGITLCVHRVDRVYDAPVIIS
jgi:hypothetical protein